MIVWLDTIVPPPAALIASRQSSTVPDAAPFVPPVTRNVSALMFSRLNGPFSSIQSPALRLPRWSPPPTSVDAAVFVPRLVEDDLDLLPLLPDLVLGAVVSAGTPPAPPWSVYDALITPNTLPPCETSSASVGRTPEQPVDGRLGVAVRVVAEHERDLRPRRS